MLYGARSMLSGRDTVPNPFRAAILAKMGFASEGIPAAQLPLRHPAKFGLYVSFFPAWYVTCWLLAVFCSAAESSQVRTAIHSLSSLCWTRKQLPPLRSWSWSGRIMDQRDPASCTWSQNDLIYSTFMLK